MAERELRNKIYNSKVELVKSMSGRATDPILTKENSKSFGPTVKLSLGLRQSYRDEEVISEERRILDQMLQDELNEIAGKFNALPILNQICRTNPDGTINEPSSSSSASASHGEGENTRTNTSGTNSYTSARSAKKSNNSKKSKNNSIITEGSSGSGPLEYSSPNKRMKDLQEQVSTEFSMGKFENIEPTPEKRRGPARK